MEGYLPKGFRKWLVSSVRPGKLRWIKGPISDSADLWQAAVSSCLNASLIDFGRISLPQSEEGTLERMLRWDQENYLRQDVLWISDMAGMAESVETRFPFLHPAMTGLAESIPLSERMGKGRKELLKGVFRSFFGEKLAQRPKQGFGISTRLSTSDRAHLEQWLKILQASIPEIWSEPEWTQFRSQALNKPEKFLQEWISLGRLASWLQQFQKP
jgi:asparagine synthetase B (glutamine-hydrolysing)